MKFNHNGQNITVTGTLAEFADMTPAQFYDFLQSNVQAIINQNRQPYVSLLERDRADIPQVNYIGDEIAEKLRR